LWGDYSTLITWQAEMQAAQEGVPFGATHLLKTLMEPNK
jgi:hypothetical protein